MLKAQGVSEKKTECFTSLLMQFICTNTSKLDAYSDIGVWTPGYS